MQPSIFVYLSLLVQYVACEQSYLSVVDHNKDKNASKRPTIKVPLTPETQHIPLDASQAHLCPPSPRIPTNYSMFVGLSAFRDGIRCGKTIFAAYQRTTNPNQLYFGVVDQVYENDTTCIESYCSLAKVEWRDHECKYRNQIRIDQRDAAESRGPTYARHFQQKLLGDQEFCLQLDAHSIFTRNWDLEIVKEWKSVGNEMAILSTYLHNIDGHVDKNGSNIMARTAPHLCQTTRGGSGNVRNVAADLIYNSKKPQLSALWGAGLSFGKCHAEKRVPIDSHTKWMFDGEEFLRASHLWTHGYDVYSPSIYGLVVYHNYTRVPATFFQLKVDGTTKQLETQRANNRVKYMVGIPFKGEMDGEELDIYNWGTVRTFEQYLKFSGLSFKPDTQDQQSCSQLHWVPYSNPQPIEDLLPGWSMTPPPKTIALTTTVPLNATTPKLELKPAMRKERLHGVDFQSTKPLNSTTFGICLVFGIVVVIFMYFAPKSDDSSKEQ
ncbi:GlcNac transferase [Thraustotheca clavata]|uniref:GlcNac transferase n=1 Tax=Thraustotheca clavata TaxID=74557 RepID=A0A1V9YYK1_9STRA|nr:GlcNac transferase [Thraustotheca clavata]